MSDIARPQEFQAMEHDILLDTEKRKRALEKFKLENVNYGKVEAQSNQEISDLDKIQKSKPKKCAHGKRKQFCVECKGNYLNLIHFTIYILNPGSQICPHLKRKSKCKECGG